MIVPKGVFDRDGALGFEQPANHSKEHRFVVNADPGRAKSLPQVLVTTIDRVVEEASACPEVGLHQDGCRGL